MRNKLGYDTAGVPGQCLSLMLVAPCVCWWPLWFFSCASSLQGLQCLHPSLHTGGLCSTCVLLLLIGVGDTIGVLSFVCPVVSLVLLCSVGCSPGIGCHSTHIPPHTGIGCHITHIPPHTGIGCHIIHIPPHTGIGCHIIHIPPHTGIGCHITHIPPTQALDVIIPIYHPHRHWMS